MKNFVNAKVQYATVDFETEEVYRINLSNLVEGADEQGVLDIGLAFDTILETNLDYADIVETQRVRPQL